MISLKMLLIVLVAATLQLSLGNSEKQQDEASLLGIVTEADNDQPVNGATVHIADLDLRLSTDVQGTFFIPEIEPGTYTLSIEHDDYESHEKEITLDGGDEHTVEVVMKPK